ncbi:MAG: prenyltransferase/squalene oxidase repeat-containing protein [Acidobacteriota bacterium]
MTPPPPRSGAARATSQPPASLEESAAAAHRRVLGEARRELLGRRLPAGPWRGQLSSSALSTAVVTFALAYASAARRGGAREERECARLVRRGLDWLADHGHEDGGYGDTVRSRSNLPTTTLCWAALSYASSRRQGGPLEPRHLEALRRSGAYLEERAGGLEPDRLRRVIEDLYGDDKTFSVPILTLCALAGVLGEDAEAFRGARALPFELALFPQKLFRFLGLPVVSYALPALIAVGQVQHHRRPSRNPLLRLVRGAARAGTLRRLEAIQPSSGGFLEATPLTGFVVLSLAGAGHADHPVVDRALEFFARSVLEDGSWPIDENLSTWVSTLSIQALSEADGLASLGEEGRATLRRWLLAQQYREVHPFTGAAPGGWAWTDLPGGVPDADDTPGALLALSNLAAARGEQDSEAPRAEDLEASCAGIGWLLDLQNRDGGMPTFCRGWGRLPFDRSSPDLTAHSLRAYSAWRDRLPPALAARVSRASRAALRYLARQQRKDGSWVPLWFGNEEDPRLENRVYGTSRVLRALELEPGAGGDAAAMARRGLGYLLSAQNSDGGFGGAWGVPSSFEETALALDALAGGVDLGAGQGPGEPNAERQAAARAAVAYLAAAWDRGDWRQARPIGFYFANLWYFEELYPLAFAVSALARAAPRPADPAPSGRARC